VPEGKVEESVLLGLVPTQNGDQLTTAENEYVEILGGAIGDGIDHAHEAVDQTDDTGVFGDQAPPFEDQVRRNSVIVRCVYATGGVSNANPCMKTTQGIGQRGHGFGVDSAIDDSVEVVFQIGKGGLYFIVTGAIGK
jgi:hypothetical protein